MTSQSRLSHTSTRIPEAPRGLVRGLGAVMIAVADRWGTWNDRRRQRMALQALPDHLLHDIGLSRADVANEADKPFWKG
ncbi:DUF1127 domain-containing protein [Azospirillum halopraeferens]|uniref:DUF1127 domain-containing protein n=1 Tax=Azospirillum halopraeferens TaxID=34010 RepID=UPI000409BDEB|nr:DUF1127 domain-containing protein [Azospirillum halopraeferens]